MIAPISWLPRQSCQLLFGSQPHAVELGQPVLRCLPQDEVCFSSAAKRKRLKPLYPEVKRPRKKYWLQVDKTHKLYIEESGNPNGVPIVVVHPGPGVGHSPRKRQLFDPNFYRIIQFDQRGAGKSTPYGSLVNNNTEALIQDMEKIRKHLGVDQWLLFGTSWGTTLSLSYAQAYPERVSGMILGSMFLGRPEEIQWLYPGEVDGQSQIGANMIFPEAWQRFIAPIPENERGDMVNAYLKRLRHPDVRVQRTFAKHWANWEEALIRLHPDPQRYPPESIRAYARIEAYYFRHGSVFDDPEKLIKPENIAKIRHIPTRIIQGRYDSCTPIKTAYDLHQAFPEADLRVITLGGHSYMDAHMRDAIITATDDFKRIVAT